MLHKTAAGNRKNLNLVAKLLFDNGADTNVMDKSGKKPFYYLQPFLNTDLKKRFTEAEVDITNHIMTC